MDTENFCFFFAFTFWVVIYYILSFFLFSCLLYVFNMHIIYHFHSTNVYTRNVVYYSTPYLHILLNCLPACQPFFLPLSTFFSLLKIKALHFIETSSLDTWNLEITITFVFDCGLDIGIPLLNPTSAQTVYSCH